MLAEVEVQKLQQNAEREKVQAQITVTQATAKANAVRAEAQAAADALRLNGEARATNIRITGDAEAAAIEARAKALGTNPNLVTLVQAERWNGVLPTTMPGSSASAATWPAIFRPTSSSNCQRTMNRSSRSARRTWRCSSSTSSASPPMPTAAVRPT